MRKRDIQALFLLLALSPNAWAGTEGQPPLRARPPGWSADVVEVFFEDTREHLIGERPQPASTGFLAAAIASGPVDNQAEMKWSTLIEEDAITMEVKLIQNRLILLLSRAGSFKSGGNVDCRHEFSLLATLFGVVDEYDQEVRWQQEAARMRGLCSRAAQACETASDESLALADDASSQIADLLNGQSVSRQEPGEVMPIDRSQLMLRMELAMEESISPWLASRKAFRRRKSDVVHESQLLAMLARIICREGYEFADDEGFVEIGRGMELASRELTEASERGNYEAAREAAGRVTQSCSDCHDGYRG